MHGSSGQAGSIDKHGSSGQAWEQWSSMGALISMGAVVKHGSSDKHGSSGQAWEQ